jgi:hypothetical protein
MARHGGDASGDRTTDGTARRHKRQISATKHHFKLKTLNNRTTRRKTGCGRERNEVLEDVRRAC